MLKRLGLFTSLFAFVLASWAPLQAQGLTRNGRWLTYNGTTPYYVGWFTAQVFADPAVDYKEKLDLFQAYGINKVRIWLYNYYGEGYYQPWSFDTVTSKYDLDSWNPVFWFRLRDFVSKARARGIIVEVSIFPVNNINRQENVQKYLNAWLSRDNSNGAFAINANGHFIPQFFNLNLSEMSSSNKKLIDYQQALIDKTLAELAPYDNVYYEVMNEFPSNDPTVASATDPMIYGWHQHWLDYIAARTPRLVTAHAQQGWGANTSGIGNYWDRASVDVLNFHFKTFNVQQISDLLHSAQDKGKVLTNNEGDPYCDIVDSKDPARCDANPTALNSETRFAWWMLLAGGYYDWLEDNSQHIGQPTWEEAATRALAMRVIAEEVQFHRMSPIKANGSEYDADLTLGPAPVRQLMAEPGERYLAYFQGTPSTQAARIALPAGSYTYRWYDVRTGGEIAAGGPVSGSSSASIPAPPISSWSGNAGVALTIVKAVPLPVITLTVSDAEASESPTNTGRLTLTRTGSTAAPLTINLTRSGTATNAADYTSIATTQTFISGQNTLLLTVRPINDTAIEDVETATLTLAAGTGYTIGSPATGTVAITSNDFTACVPSATRLCLQGGRFEATLTATVNSTTYIGQAHPLSNATGAFWLFSPENIEVAVKVLDGSPVSGQFSVYHGAATDQPYTLTVKDRANASRVRTFSKAAGTLCGGADLGYFIKSDLAIAEDTEGFDTGLIEPSPKAFTCVANATTACLLGNRFQVRIKRGTVNQQAIQMTSETGGFWFLSADNLEVFVKMLDGTPINGKYWMLAGALTDLAYSVEVTDSTTGVVKTYSSQGPYCGQADVAAF